MPKNYFITGGAGFIGSNYVNRLLERGERVETAMLEASVAAFPWPVLYEAVGAGPTVPMGNRDDAMVDRLFRAICESDAVDRARTLAGEYAGKAVAAISTLPAGAHHSALNELATFAVHRDQ